MSNAASDISPGTSEGKAFLDTAGVNHKHSWCYLSRMLICLDLCEQCLQPNTFFFATFSQPGAKTVSRCKTSSKAKRYVEGQENIRNCVDLSPQPPFGVQMIPRVREVRK